MKKSMVKMRAIVIVVALLCLFTGCRHQDNSDAEKSEENCCIIDGRIFYFVSDQKKQEWIEPLVKLLSNERREIYERSASEDNYIIPDSDSPYIEQCYSCGLFDVTGDGVPELLVHPWGYFGSSGTETYFIYDIYTGQKIGSIDSGNGGTCCAYYDIAIKEIKLVNQYWLRSGWAYRERFLSMITRSDDGEYCDRVYLYANYAIDGENQNIVDEDPDDGYYTATWVETYPNTHYWINGETAYLDEYYAELDSFHRECIRIAETELTMIKWSDYTSDEDTRFERAQKMAEELVSSGQEFICAPNNKQ